MGKKTKSLAALLVEYFKTKIEAKRLYQSADRQKKNLRRLMRVGKGIAVPKNADAGISDGKEAVLVNNFAGTDEVWGHGKVSKHDIVLKDREL